MGVVRSVFDCARSLQHHHAPDKWEIRTVERFKKLKDGFVKTADTVGIMWATNGNSRINFTTSENSLVCQRLLMGLFLSGISIILLTACSNSTVIHSGPTPCFQRQSPYGPKYGMWVYCYEPSHWQFGQDDSWHYKKAAWPCVWGLEP